MPTLRRRTSERPKGAEQRICACADLQGIHTRGSIRTVKFFNTSRTDHGRGIVRKRNNLRLVVVDVRAGIVEIGTDISVASLVVNDASSDLGALRELFKASGGILVLTSLRGGGDTDGSRRRKHKLQCLHCVFPLFSRERRTSPPLTRADSSVDEMKHTKRRQSMQEFFFDS